jgi:phosphate transport system substrate-binding protein
MVFTEVIKSTSLKIKKIKSNKRSFSLLLLLLLFAVSCSSRQEETSIQRNPIIPTDTLYLAADSAQAKMLNTLIFVYEGLNQSKKVIPIYSKEKSLYRFLKNNEADVILRSYPLNEVEQNEITKRQLNAKQHLVWHDALAVIINKNSTQNTITEQEFKDAVVGKHSSMKVLLDKANSSSYDILCGTYFSEADDIKAFAAGTEENIIKQVAKKTDYIGIVSSGRFTGYFNAKDSLLKQVKVLGIVPYGKINAEYPFQDQLYNNVYPLARTVHTIDVGALDGLGSSFVAFILSERGQRIILKSGLLPATIPPRTVELN